jgi:hypothetical protein
MKKLLAMAATAATLAPVAVVPVRADTIDMSSITCAQLISMKQDEISFILNWIQGYLAGTKGETSLDTNVLGQSITDTITFCQNNQEKTVMDATKEVDAK